jgi:predicted ATP-binding protein involved in virulence
MIAWVVDLAARMFARYPDSDNPLSEPAVVLVDEIDLHLHPKWQRDIFRYLSERFPNTQFIVTAHSPLIVQAAPEDANIVVLRKEGDTVVIDQEVENVRKWRIDQILTSDLFGLDSTRSPEVTGQMQERVELLSKTSLSPEEHDRLKVLNELAASLPTADTPTDIEAMEIIRKAAAYLKETKDTDL